MQLDPRESQVTRLVVAIAIVLVVAAIAGAYLYSETRGTVEGVQRERLSGEATTHADRVDQMLAAQIRLSEMMADSIYQFEQQTSTEFGREQRIGNLLVRNYEANDILNDVQYIDESGELIYAGNVNGEQRDLDRTTLDLEATTSVGAYPDRDEILIASPTKGNKYVVLVINATKVAARTESVVAGSETRLVTSDGTIVFSTADQEEVGQQYGTGTEGTAVVDRALTEDEQAGTVTLSASGTPDDQQTVAGYNRLETVDWVLVSSTPPDRLFALAGTVAQDLVYLIGVMAVLLVAFVGTVNYPNLRAISTLSEQARRVREGEEATFESNRRDEIGDLYHSIAEMRTALNERLEEAERAQRRAEQAQKEAEQAQANAQEARAEMEEFNRDLRAEARRYGQTMDAVADGDLTQRLEVTIEEESFETIASSFNAMMDDLEGTVRESQTFATDVADAISEIHTTIQEVETISEETTRVGQEISAEADDQLSALRNASEEVSDLSATVEEVTSSVENVAGTAQAAAEHGRAGRERASDGLTAMEEMRERVAAVSEDVERLGSEVEQINEIVDVIGDIAEQTNMLALNASIEAARAGNATSENGTGDGFAVVADEIKGLANETATQAGDIEQRVTTIQQSTTRTVREMEATSDRIEEGAETIEAALEALDDIVEDVTTADQSLKEVTDATTDQAEMTQSIVQMVKDVSESAEQTAQRAREAAQETQTQSEAISDISATIESLTTKAEGLQESVSRFETQASSSGFETGEATARQD